METNPEVLSLKDAARRSGRTVKAMRQPRYRQARGEQVGPRFRQIDGRVMVASDDLAAWLAGDTDPAT
jgi:hypothetical protein